MACASSRHQDGTHLEVTALAHTLERLGDLTSLLHGNHRVGGVVEAQVERVDKGVPCRIAGDRRRDLLPVQAALEARRVLLCHGPSIGGRRQGGDNNCGGDLHLVPSL